MEPIALKKINTKEIMLPRILAVPDKPEKLYVVYGVANGAVKKPTKFNPNGRVVTGRFEVVRASDRQSFTSQFLYLPDNTYQEQLANMCVSADGEVKEINFGFVISYKAGASPQGYVYVVEPMLDQSAQDALADVRKQAAPLLDKFLPALAAPASPATGANKK